METLILGHKKIPSLTLCALINMYLYLTIKVNYLNKSVYRTQNLRFEN